MPRERHKPAGPDDPGNEAAGQQRHMDADSEPEPEPERILQPVPDPDPDLDPGSAPDRGPERDPAADANVVALRAGREPRRWNLWDLERLSRENAGADVALDEERTFLLMYLREFAGPDGLLPVDFDGLVRDSFGTLVGVP
jgi:hypothetical protein